MQFSVSTHLGVAMSCVPRARDDAGRGSDGSSHVEGTCPPLYNVTTNGNVRRMRFEWDEVKNRRNLRGAYEEGQWPLG